MSSGSPICFGAFELNLVTGEIRKSGRVVQLSPQPFRLLALLASAPGQLMTRDAIRQQLWGNNSLIDFEGRLNFCIRKIRIVLGDNSKRPRYIETLPRRGYRFVAKSSTRPQGPPAGSRRNGVPSDRPVAGGVTSSEDARQAIAIVEFLNVSGDPEIDWLATGMAETLAADLRRLPSVWVVSADRVRATTAKLGQLTPARPPADCLRLGRELNADWVVSGSYQRAGSNLRITPQLANIRTGEAIAVGKIDGTWEQLFEWQDRLASALIGALELETTISRPRPGELIASRHVQAYEEYSRARMRFRQLDKATLDDARRHFQRALEFDPQYAMAHAGLGATHAMRFIHRTNPADLSDAKTHLQLACQLDAELAEPYPWLCYVYMRDGQLREAQRTGQRAIELLPDLVQAHYFLALAYFVSCESDPSQYQQAADHLLRAARVDPRWQATWFVLSVLALLSGNYRRAEECATRLLHADAASPGAVQFIGAEVLLATVCLRRGDHEDAIQWLAQSATKLAASNHMYREGMMALTSCVLGDVHLRQQNPDAALLDYRQAWQTIQEYPTMLANDRHRVRALAGLAAAHAARGESERSDELILRAAATLETAKAPQSSAAGASLADLHFAVAAAHIRAENTDEALDSLECAVKAGWRDATWLRHDSELQPVRTEPRFVELDKELRRLPELDLEL